LFHRHISGQAVHAKDEIEGVLAAQARNPGGSLIVMPDVFNVVNRELIIALAARYGVPAIYFNTTYFAKLGGLISYSTDVAESFVKRRGTSTASSRARSLPISPYKRRQSTSW